MKRVDLLTFRGFLVSYLIAGLFLIGCKSTVEPTEKKEEFVIAFGSCNKVDQPNPFWGSVTHLRPDLWIWGGDNIYADTADMEAMKAMYEAQNAVPGYAQLLENTPVIGTWDDHDYGLNDGGTEFDKKAESQQLLLDFLGVPKDSPRREQEGVYTVHSYKHQGQEIRVFVLDTRYFRTALKKGEGKKRYAPTAAAGQNMLGEAQWKWLEVELKASKARFNLLVSSIQFISEEHGFEKWANMPDEMRRMEKLIQESGAKGVFFISGDRHISEFSKKELQGLEYPLWDFTSSGLTHSYSSFSGEPNRHRIGEVQFEKSFGLIRLDVDSGLAVFEIRGEEGKVLQSFRQFY